MYLSPVEEIDADALMERFRQTRVLVFRPLFVYRQQKIKKQKVDAQRRKDKKKMTTTMKTTKTTMITTTTPKPIAYPSSGYGYHEYSYPNYYGYHPVYIDNSQSNHYYQKPSAIRPPYQLNDGAIQVLNTYPRKEYSAYYPNYIWSNYVENPNRRT